MKSSSCSEQVIGTTGGVFFVDVKNVISTPSAHTEYQNVMTHYLTHDDSIDMTAGKVAQGIKMDC